ncbi:MAG: hypothetical protein ACLGIN_12095 [Candidatus Sericytochromatia bacterium]
MERRPTPRRRRARQRRLSRAFRRVRAVALLTALAAGVAWGLPEPDAEAAARSNAQVLSQLVERYAEAHEGAPAGDLGTLSAFAAAEGLEARVRNPYSGVVAGFDDPAIARPLFLHRGVTDEAGVVFYRALVERAAWEIRVADATGDLAPDPQAVQLAGGLR